jgi:hypothetical protein
VSVSTKRVTEDFPNDGDCGCGECDDCIYAMARMEYKKHVHREDVFFREDVFKWEWRREKGKQILDLYDKLRDKYGELSPETAVVFKGNKNGRFDFKYVPETVSEPIHSKADKNCRCVSVEDKVREYIKDTNFNCVTVWHNHDNATGFSHEDIETFLSYPEMCEIYIDSFDILFLVKDYGLYENQEKVNILRKRLGGMIDSISEIAGEEYFEIREKYKFGGITFDEACEEINFVTGVCGFATFALIRKRALVDIYYGRLKKPEVEEE